MTDHLTASYARRLLERCTGGVWVRTQNKPRSPHHGRARLLAVLSEDSAVIQPAAHRRREQVPLARLKLWRSRTMSLNPEKAAIVNPEACYVLVRRDGSLWAGKAHWSRDQGDANEYDQRGAASRARGRMARFGTIASREDVEIVRKDRLDDFLRRIADGDAAEAPAPPAAEAPNAPKAPAIQADLPAEPTDDLSEALDLLRRAGSDLVEARNLYRDAIREVRRAREMFDAAMAKELGEAGRKGAP